MMTPGASREIEVKLRVEDLGALRRRLAKAGARPDATGRVHESNTLYDTPQGGLAKHGQLLRIRRIELPKARRAAPAAVLTYKGPSEKAAPAGGAQGARYKVREEIELPITDPERLGTILEALGLRGWFRYEKFRTAYRLPPRQGWAAGLHVMLDETPIGAFVELEGPPQAIDRMAGLLGYRPGDYLTKSYLALYLDQCHRQGTPPAHMVFSAGDEAQKK